jgi:hypothetical protein
MLRPVARLMIQWLAVRGMDVLLLSGRSTLSWVADHLLSSARASRSPWRFRHRQGGIFGAVAAAGGGGRRDAASGMLAGRRGTRGTRRMGDVEEPISP